MWAPAPSLGKLENARGKSPWWKKLPKQRHSPYLIPRETTKLRAMICNRTCWCFTVLQTSGPHSSCPVQGHLNSLGAYMFACSASAFSIPWMHRTNPNNFELFYTSVLPSPGVVSEHLPPTHPPGTFPSSTGTPVETHCSQPSETMDKFPPLHLPRAGFQPSKAHQTKHHREPALFPSWP